MGTKEWFQGEAQIVKQAKDQLWVAGGAPITWYVAEQGFVTVLEKILRGQGDNWHQRRLRGTRGAVRSPPSESTRQQILDDGGVVLAT